MLLFSLSLSLPYLLNPSSPLLSIISSFRSVIHLNLINFSNEYHLLQIDFILMLDNKISSASSKSTFAFETSSIPSNASVERIDSTKSIDCFHNENTNQNANDIEENLSNEKKSLHRLVQSSTDIKINDHSSSDKASHRNRAFRIESALMTSDYSHLFKHSIIKQPSRSIMNLNMNRTIDFIKRNGAGDEYLSSQFIDKQIQATIQTDQNDYLPLEQVPISNRRMISFTVKQLLFISISVFVSVTLLCLVAIIWIF